MYRQLLQHLLPQQAAYPMGFESWDQCVDEDEEEFYRFRCVLLCSIFLYSYNPVHGLIHPHLLPHAHRSGPLHDALDCCYAVLRYQMFAHVGGIVQQAGNAIVQLGGNATQQGGWQHVEAALYAVQYVLCG